MPLEAPMYLKQAKRYKLIKSFLGILNVHYLFALEVTKRQQSLVVTHCGMFSINYRYISIFHLLCL